MVLSARIELATRASDARMISVSTREPRAVGGNRTRISSVPERRSAIERRRHWQWRWRELNPLISACKAVTRPDGAPDESIACGGPTRSCTALHRFADGVLPRSSDRGAPAPGVGIEPTLCGSGPRLLPLKDPGRIDSRFRRVESNHDSELQRLAPCHW